MALTKTTENDKIEVVNKWNIQVRTATIVKEDGTELTRTFHRKTLVPGSLDASGLEANTYTPALGCQDSNSAAFLNFGQDGTFGGAITAGGNSDANGIGNFKYSVPSGYKALCTKNLGS